MPDPATITIGLKKLSAYIFDNTHLGVDGKPSATVSIESLRQISSACEAAMVPAMAAPMPAATTEKRYSRKHYHYFKTIGGIADKINLSYKTIDKYLKNPQHPFRQFFVYVNECGWCISKKAFRRLCKEYGFRNPQKDAGSLKSR